MVIRRWNAGTGQELDETDPRLTLLGDRGDHGHALTEHLWRVTHAATIYVIYRAAKTSRECKEPHQKHEKASALLTRVRKLTQQLIQTAWQERRANDKVLWQEWRAAGMVNARKDKAVFRVLEGGNGFQWQKTQQQKKEVADYCIAHNAHALSIAHEPVKYWQYTDGAWEGEQRGDDPAQQGGVAPPAGYGVVELRAEDKEAVHGTPTADEEPACSQEAACELEVQVPIMQLLRTDSLPYKGPTASITWTCSGQVQTEPGERDYIGATTETNNTGELSALHYAIARARTRPRGAGHECIAADSTYAINMATGKWLPKPRSKGWRNAPMITRLRAAWRALQKERPDEVTLCHVRSHVQVPGNEIADWLAQCGAEQDNVSVTRAQRWIKQWLTDTLGSGAAREAPERGGGGQCRIGHGAPDPHTGSHGGGR